jgi:type I restriction enzyme R subunit
LDETAEEINPAEELIRSREPMPVVYNSKIPPEFFDFIIIDECHRSISKSQETSTFTEKRKTV